MKNFRLFHIIPAHPPHWVGTSPCAPLPETFLPNTPKLLHSISQPGSKPRLVIPLTKIRLCSVRRKKITREKAGRCGKTREKIRPSGKKAVVIQEKQPI